MHLSSDARAAKERAHSFTLKSEWDKAAAEYRKVLKAQPEDLAARQKLAEVLAKAGRTRDAVAEYQHVAGAYLANGFQLKAIAINKVILQLDPTHTETQSTLSQLVAGRERNTGRSITLPKSMTGSMPAVRQVAAAVPAASTAERARMEWSDILDTSEMRVAAGFLGIKAPKTAPPPPPPPDPTVEVIEVDDSVDVLLDVTAIPPIPLFSELNAAAFEALLECLNLRAVHAGQVLMREGEPGASMFVIVQGEVEVRRLGAEGQEKVLAKMVDGAFFGEMALLSNAPRVATVVASQDTVLLELTRPMLEDISRQHSSVGAVVERFYRERLLANLLRSNAVFKPLPDAAKEELSREFQALSVEPGKELLTQGQPGDGLYLVLRGRCEASSTAANGLTAEYPAMTEGDLFGEISLLQGVPVTATVCAVSPCLLLKLSREAFNRLVRPHAPVQQAIERILTKRLDRTNELLLDMDLSF